MSIALVISRVLVRPLPPWRPLRLEASSRPNSEIEPALTPGDPPTAVVTIDQLKLVNPDPQTMKRGDDGLFRTADGNAADADPAVTLAPASLEGSNVNPVSAMVAMITNARQFQMQTKLLESADKNDQSANQLLSFS